MNNHILMIEQRQKVRISSVKSTERFSCTEVRVYTECGDLLIKGDNLDVLNCPEGTGDVEVVGHVDSASYISENCHIPDNFLAKLFK